MNRNPHFGPGFSMIFIISALLLVSCVTARKVPLSRIHEMPDGKKIYYFHSEDSTWIVYPITGEMGQFTGVIVRPQAVKENKLREIHIYAGPQSAIKISSNTLICPMVNIVKIENYKLNAGMVISSIGVVLLLFLVPAIL